MSKALKPLHHGGTEYTEVFEDLDLCSLDGHLPCQRSNFLYTLDYGHSIQVSENSEFDCLNFSVSSVPPW